jgi:hypothetical protein
MKSDTRRSWTLFRFMVNPLGWEAAIAEVRIRKFFSQSTRNKKAFSQGVTKATFGSSQGREGISSTAEYSFSSAEGFARGPLPTVDDATKARPPHQPGAAGRAMLGEAICLDMAEQYRLTYAALLSLFLLLVGLWGVSTRLLYLLVVSALDLWGSVFFFLIFAIGICVYVWDRNKQRTLG